MFRAYAFIPSTLARHSLTFRGLKRVVLVWGVDSKPGVQRYMKLINRRRAARTCGPQTVHPIPHHGSPFLGSSRNPVSVLSPESSCGKHRLHPKTYRPKPLTPKLQPINPKPLNPPPAVSQDSIMAKKRSPISPCLQRTSDKGKIIVPLK